MRKADEDDYAEVMTELGGLCPALILQDDVTEECVSRSTSRRETRDAYRAWMIPGM